MNLTVACRYNFLVYPYSNVTGCCWFLYRVCNGISGLHPHNLQDSGFCTVAVLLPPLLVLKAINCKFNHYLNTVYYSKPFVFQLVVSSAPPQNFFCSCGLVQQYLPCKTSKYYIFRYVCILNCTTFNAHAPYCHIGPLLQYSNLPHYNLIGRIFQEKIWTLFMCCDFFRLSENLDLKRTE
jgi:hypothetical protein